MSSANYNYIKIEEKWQKKWLEKKIYLAKKQNLIIDWEAENGQAIKQQKNQGNMQFLRQRCNSVGYTHRRSEQSLYLPGVC